MSIDHTNDDADEHTPTSRAESEESPTSTPSPPRRSSRQRVLTPKAQLSAGTNRKVTAGSSKKSEIKDVKHREIDNSAQRYWIARVRRF